MPTLRTRAKSLVLVDHKTELSGKERVSQGDRRKDTRTLNSAKRKTIGESDKVKMVTQVAETVEKESNNKKRKLDVAAAASFTGKELITPGSGQRDYFLTAGEPSREPKTGEFDFVDWPEFRPNLSPEEIIRAGAFGGSYFRRVKSKKMKRDFVDDWKDLPSEWYSNLDPSHYLTRNTYEPSITKWKADVGLPFEEWEKKGWIRHEFDCRGWFQWYCRFFRGRRCEDDERQIGRWIRIASPASGRWRRVLLGKYLAKEINEIERTLEPVSPGIRQTLLHWAFEPTTDHLNEFREEKGQDVANRPDEMGEVED
ncbi:hypothetical protein T439DRAFT_325967 [Meredithblackwellia eburnea MCA 4105]